MDAGLRAASGAIAVAVVLGLAVAVSAMVATLARRRRLRLRPAVACLAAGYGAAAVTLTLWPATARPGHEPAALENLLAGPSSPAELAANVLLFLPLGAAVGWLFGRGRPSAGPVVAVLAVPLLVEVVQLVVAPLHRDPSVADVVANTAGLAAGLLVGRKVAASSPPPRSRERERRSAPVTSQPLDR